MRARRFSLGVVVVGWARCLPKDHHSGPSEHVPLKLFFVISFFINSPEQNRVPMTMPTVKVCYNQDLRRVQLPEGASTTFSSFTGVVGQLWPAAVGQRVTLTYVDDEGDRVAVSSDAELLYRYL